MNLNDFKNIPFKKRTKCAVCKKELGNPLIKLPSYPLTETYIKEKLKEPVGFVDQNFCICKECGHGQLTSLISPEILYGHAYAFRTAKSTWGATKGNDFLIAFIDKITKKKKFKTIIEIGCNDLYLLNLLKPRAERLIGIDPILKGREKEFSDEKITAIGDFFENVDLRQYINSGETLILTSQVLEHIENPRLMIEKLLEVSTDKTLFAFIFPGFDALLKEGRFDQIFHHHLHYFSLYSFTHLLNKLSCKLIGSDVNHHYWGSLAVTFKKEAKKKINPLRNTDKMTSEKVAKNFNIFKQKMNFLNRYLTSVKGEELFGYGAGLQLAVFGYHLNNDFSSFNCIIDDDEAKDGLFYLNLPVSIKSSAKIDMNKLKEAIVVITAINFSRGILKRLIPLNPKRIILPFNNLC